MYITLQNHDERLPNGKLEIVGLNSKIFGILNLSYLIYTSNNKWDISSLSDIEISKYSLSFYWGHNKTQLVFFPEAF